MCFAVDVKDHQICRPAAGRPGRGGLVRQHQGHAAQLDRSLTGQTAEAKPARLTSLNLPPTCNCVCEAVLMSVFGQLHALHATASIMPVLGEHDSPTLAGSHCVLRICHTAVCHETTNA